MKNIKKLAILLTMVGVSGAAYADGMMFEPVDVNYTPADKPTVTSATQAPSVVGTVETEKFQSAILQLDSAQVELRNNYLQYKEKFQQIDAQYVQVKAERKETKKMVKSLERKIKDIESTKSKIRRTMQ